MITPTVTLHLLIDLIVKGEKYDPDAPEEERKTLEEVRLYIVSVKRNI